jgi:DNA-binding NtrC family response regulator
MATKAIAIIDDEIDVMNLFKEALEQNGFLVCAFSDSIQAYKILEKEIQEYGLYFLIFVCLILMAMSYAPN